MDYEDYKETSKAIYTGVVTGGIFGSLGLIYQGVINNNTLLSFVGGIFIIVIPAIPILIKVLLEE